MKEIDMDGLYAEALKYWNGDERMAKFITNSQKIVELRGLFVQVCDRLPSISKSMYYDDETEGPDRHSFDDFTAYNSRNLPDKFKLSEWWRGDEWKLYIIQPRKNSRIASVQALTDNDVKRREEKHDYTMIEASEQDLKVINQAIEEVRQHYKKRLKTYWKKYKDKVYAVGYWANR